MPVRCSGIKTSNKNNHRGQGGTSESIRGRRMKRKTQK